MGEGQTWQRSAASTSGPLSEVLRGLQQERAQAKSNGQALGFGGSGEPE